jgi:hypothetical protein
MHVQKVIACISQITHIIKIALEKNEIKIFFREYLKYVLLFFVHYPRQYPCVTIIKHIPCTFKTSSLH